MVQRKNCRDNDTVPISAHCSGSVLSNPWPNQRAKKI